MKKSYHKLLFILAFAFSVSCKGLPFTNPCYEEKFLEDVRAQTAFYVWSQQNPMEALLLGLGVGFSLITGETQEVESALMNKIEPIMRELKLIEKGKARKTEDGVFKCSVLFEYKGNRFLVNYDLRQMHSGKEGDLYRIENFEISSVER